MPPSLEPAQLGLEPPGGAGACRRSPLKFRTLHCMVSTRRSWGCAAQPGAGAAGAGAARRPPAPCLALPARGSFRSPSLEPAQLGLEPARRSRSLPALPPGIERFTVWLAGALGLEPSGGAAPCLALPACRPAWSRRSWSVDPPRGAGTSPRPAWSGRSVGSNRPEAPEVPAPLTGTGTKHKALTELRVLGLKLSGFWGLDLTHEHYIVGLIVGS
jgi:hypothetical protein